MRFAVFTHVPHFIAGNSYFAYAPYVREMDLWLDLVSEVEIVAPVKNDSLKSDQAYKKKDILFSKIPSISFLGIGDFFISIFKIPLILLTIFKAMLKADHLHIRCPGNIGLLACFVQILFPGKLKTFKYAGNWDPSSKQPWSYRLQKFLISNSQITRNSKVLVYGEWTDQPSHIIPFFTASYNFTDIMLIKKEFSPPFRFLFVGSLSEGKRPLLALTIIKRLKETGKDVRLDIYGSGQELEKIKSYIIEHQLESIVNLHGAQEAFVLKDAYLNSHFSILPSKSEGWPKALAEAMFYGCIPIATKISCVPWMLGQGARGILIDPESISAVNSIETIFDAHDKMQQMSEDAMKWSQRYTLDYFQAEIKELL